MATFGNTAKGDQLVNMLANSKWVCRFYLAERGDVTSIVAFLASGGAGPFAIVRAVIYSDLNANPERLLAQIPLPPNSVGPLDGMPGKWITFDLSTPLRLEPGWYWLGVQNGVDWCITWFTLTGAAPKQWQTNDDSFDDGATDPFGPPHPTWGLQDRIGSIYAIYIPAVTALDIHAFAGVAEVGASGKIIETGQTFVTPTTIMVAPGTYTVEATYQAQTQTKTVPVAESETKRVDFYFVAVTYLLQVSSEPPGIQFSLQGVISGTFTTPWSDSLNEGPYTITMPSSVIVGGINYNFQHWEDGSTNRIRSITLDRNMLLTATYVEAAPPPCFIATVAYGSPLADELNALRKFRDYCLPSQVVQIYYAVGRYLAQLIRKREATKRYVREVLNLFIRLVGD